MKALPRSAQLMGYAGLIPFLFLTLLLVTNTQFAGLDTTKNIYYLQTYAAVIISFIGAVHWGYALASEDENKASISSDRFYIYSVIPALLVWFALFFTHWTFVIQAVIIISMYLYDYTTLFKHLEVNYAKMRLHLTSVVSICLLVSAWATTA